MTEISAGGTMTEISASAAVFAIVLGISGPLVGVLFGRFGARPVMLVAAVLLAATSLAYAGMRNLATLYLIMAISGFGVAGTAGVSGTVGVVSVVSVSVIVGSVEIDVVSAALVLSSPLSLSSPLVRAKTTITAAMAPSSTAKMTGSRLRRRGES